MLTVATAWPQAKILDGPAIAASNAERIELASKLGFKLVRIPFVVEPDPKLIRLAVSSGMRVVADFHPDQAWQANPLAIYSLPEKWASWSIALREFRVDDVAFEIINEPRMGKRVAAYDAILAASIEAVREVNPGRWIVVSNPQMGDPDWYDGPLLKWQPPKASRLIATMHYYRPFYITHPQHYLSGTPVAGKAPLPIGGGTAFDVKDWENRDLHFARFVGWASEHGVTPWVGEAGCYETVPDRVRWFRTIADLAQAYQVPVCWWALGDRFGVRPGQQDDADAILGATQPDWKQVTKLRGMIVNNLKLPLQGSAIRSIFDLWQVSPLDEHIQEF